MAHEYLGAPAVLTAFDKGHLFLPRLLHILALAYALSAWPALHRLAAHPRAGTLTMLGRHSLPVFAIGTLLAYGAQVTKAVLPPSVWLDTALIAAGLAALVWVARWREGQARPRRAVAPAE